MAAMLVGLLPPISVPVAAAASTSAVGELVDSYKTNGATFTLGEGSRIFVPSDTEPEGEFLQTVQLIQRQLAADGRPTSTPMPIVWGPESRIAAGDIVLVLDENAGIGADGYTLSVTDTAVVTAGDLRGLIYGANMLQKHLRYAGSNTIAGFDAADTPDTIERVVSFDCGRKYYTKEWICNFIREMSWMGYNTLELHLSEDSGFRMDFWDPAYYKGEFQPANDFSWICGSNYTSWTLSAYQDDVDKGKYLTAGEIVEILQVAKEYQIDVLPCFDTPAHVDYLTWTFEQHYDTVDSNYSFYSTYYGKTYRAADVNGKINYTNTKDFSTALNWPYYAAVNINSELARAFILELHIDIANFFKEYAGSTHFSIGADEVNLTKALNYGSYQFDFADFIDYVWELNTLLNSMGMTVRMNNDFVGSTEYDASSYELPDNILIMYWNSPHDPNSSTPSGETEPCSYYVNKGMKVYNAIQTYTYYALRKTNYGMDARGTSSSTNYWTFYRATEEQIFNEWYPLDVSERGDYSEQAPLVPEESLAGAYFMIWCDYACINTEVEIWNGVTESVYNSSTGKKVSQYYSLRDRMWSNIIKMWNWDLNDTMTYSEFAAVRKAIGAHPGLGSGTNACAEKTTLPAGTAPVTGYTAGCTAYDSYCKIRTTTDAAVMSLPCDADVDGDSHEIGTADAGTIFSATSFYENTEGELWYRVTVGTGETGYIHATQVSFYAPIVDDITITNPSLPNAHIKGKTFSVQGIIQATRNTLTSVTVQIRKGFDLNGTVVTGGTASITNNYYSLMNSTVDNATGFGKATAGKNTYIINVTFTSTYADGDQIATYSGSLNLVELGFYVMSSSVTQSSCSHKYATETLKAATCMAEGISLESCSKCGLVNHSTLAVTDHSYSQVVTEKTCYADGYTTHTCTVCGDSYVDDFVPAGHNWDNASCTEPKTCSVCGKTEGAASGHSYRSTVIAPTCDTAGYTRYDCTVCGHSYTSNTVAALGHKYTSQVQAPTCTQDGCTTYTCSVCGDSYVDDVITARGHNNEAVVTKPTCTEGGYTTYTCTVCGNTYQDNYTTKLGHSYRSTVTSATCTTSGYTVHTCTRCGHSYTDGLSPVLGHDWADATCTEDGYCRRCGLAGEDAFGHDYVTKVTAPTCTTEGYTTHTCSSCGDSYITDRVSAFGHSWVDATCTTKKTCATCGQTQGNALGHDYDSVVTKPTCTEKGYTTHTCSRCGDTYKDASTAALGHSYKSVVTEPTCEEKGYTTHTCSRCNDSYKDTYVEAVGHSWLEVTCLEARHCKYCGLEDGKPLGHSFKSVVTAGTCTKDGYTTHTCIICEYTYTDNIVVATGHKWVAATCQIEKHCSVCGETEGTVLPHSYVAVVTKPTCTAGGYTTYTCSACGDSYVGNKVDATGHSYDSVSFSSTCTEMGGVRHTCSGCGDSYVDGRIPALGHSFQAVVVEATCTEDGYTENTCIRCGYSYKGSYVKAEGHSYKSTFTVANCVQDGYTTHTCKKCGDVYIDSFVPKSGHSWSEGDCTVCRTCSVCGVTEDAPRGHQYKGEGVEPTCTTTGCMSYTCTDCGHSYYEDVVPALGHDWADATCTQPMTCDRCGVTQGSALGHDYDSVVTKPTCTASGYTTHTCTRCDSSYTDSTTSPLGHAYVSKVTKPTCTEGGYTTHTCSRCGYSVTDSKKSPLGHSWVDATCTDAQYCDRCGITGDGALGHDCDSVVTKPTCTEKGYTTHTCSRCDYSYTDTPVAELGHSWTAATCTDGQTCQRCGVAGGGPLGHDYKSVVTAPTCTQSGYTTHTCQRCGDKYIDSTVAALGHDCDKVVTPPTCTEGGYTTNTCKRCGTVYTDSPVDALGHDWAAASCTEARTCQRCGLTDGKPLGHDYDSVVTKPTCTDKGYTTHTCSRCDDSYTDSTVNALGHSWINATCLEAKHCDRCGLVEGKALGHDYKNTVTKPTCTEKGYTTHTCKRCGDSYTDTPVAELGHDYVAAVTAPTCEDQGYTTHTCSRCGHSYTDTPVAALGHDYKSKVTDPTCTEKGYTTHTCSRCGHSYQDSTVAALGHDWAAASCTEARTCRRCGLEDGKPLGHDCDSVVTKPTCTEGGHTVHTCKRCGYTYTDGIVDALGHSWVAASCTEARRCDRCGLEDGNPLGHDYKTVVTKPTCTEGGYTTYTCSRCAHSYVGDRVEALGHDYDSVVTPATCTEDGYTTHTCSRCGSSYVDATVKALGHDYRDTVVAPTCTEKGYTAHSCSRCDEAYEDTPVAALGHDYAQTVVKPTCITGGYTLHECTRCEESYVDSVTESLGHSWVEATCTESRYCATCGVKEGAALGHSYKSVVTEPACTAEGYTTYTCSRCGHSYTGNRVAALGHDYKTVVTKPTCTTDGYTTYTCARCGDSYRDGYANALGHHYEAEVTKPTCTEKGYTAHTCSRCDDSYTDSFVAELGHDYKDTVVAPTCTDKGYTAHVCSRCADRYTDSEKAALGHQYTVEVIAPTCTEEGRTVHTCQVCRHSYTDDVKQPLGHTYQSTVVKVTCTTDGYTTHVCQTCGYSFTDSVVAARGHSWVNATCLIQGYCYVCGAEGADPLGHSYKAVVTKPTCTEGGYTTYTCANCGDSYQGDTTAATGHDWQDATCLQPSRCGSCGLTQGEAAGHQYIASVTQATCTTDGYTTYTCQTCGDAYTANVVDAYGHEWVEATCVSAKSCQRCGETEGSALGHSYESVVTPPGYGQTGFTTHTCTKCGHSYLSDPVAALNYLADCIPYRTYCQVAVTERTGVMALPCTEETVPGVKTVGFAGKGKVYSCSYFYKNTEGELWYRVTTEDGQIGYIRATETKFHAALVDDITVTDAAYPNAHVKGNVFTLSGNIKSTQNTLTTVSAAVYAGFGMTGTKLTGGSAAVSGNAYSLKNSTVDDNTLFNKVILGKSTYVVSVTYQNQYADGDSITIYTGTVNVIEHYFYVLGSAVDQSTCNHKYAETVIREATCAADGLKIRGCASCGLTEEIVLDSLAHKWVNATCYQAKHCTVCGQSEGNALSHSYAAEVVSPTCTTQGYTRYHCVNCGDSYTGDTVPVSGHDWQAASCFDPMYCGVCGNVQGQALGHNVVNGSCTRCGYSQLTAPVLTLKYATLSFEAEIRYNIYFTAESLEHVETLGMLFFHTEQLDGSIDTADRVISSYTTDGTTYMVQSDGVAAKNMGDALYFRIYAKMTDGSYVYSALKSYNAVSYAKTILGRSTSSPYMKKLVVAMLNFGAEAQLYFGYNTDQLMNDFLTAEQQALVAAYSEDTMADPGKVASDKNPLFVKKGFGTCTVTASFDSAFALNYYFVTSHVPDGDVMMYYWTEADYAAAGTLSPENASGELIMTPTGATNQYWGCLSGIAAKEMGNTFYVGGVYTSGGQTYYTSMINYSMGKYCDTIAGKTGSAQQELAKTTAVYGATAREYFASLNA